MKKFLLLGLIIILLLLDWLALDDITTNPQESYFLEYSILVFSAFAFGFLIVFILKKK